jgi:DNA mismatch endonuclease (patch repair protein)
MKKGYKPTAETRINMGKAQLGNKNAQGNKNWLGRKHSEETKKKIAAWHLGRFSSLETKEKIRRNHVGRTGQKQSEETKQKIRESNLAHPNRKFKDTGIELKVEKELINKGIPYIKQHPLHKVAIVDFYLPKLNIVIQCDGCYWHNCPIHNLKPLNGRTEKDLRQDFVLKSNKVTIYRFWEHEINESATDCIKKIKELG